MFARTLQVKLLWILHWSYSLCTVQTCCVMVFSGKASPTILSCYAGLSQVFIGCLNKGPTLATATHFSLRARNNSNKLRNKKFQAHA